MAPARGVAEPVNANLVCADILWLVEDSSWLLRRTGYTGPSRADCFPDLPYLTLNA